ncbi:MAG: hypothetical protein EON59_00150 [Alphaproteobacteria bacterium]|nr:MAG: hypothetical protein EON59_00150 [Alphaproteobacteria bacterium]
MMIRRKLLLVALALSPASAFAYVDPGSGMLIWQGLLAALGAVIIFVRNPIEQIKRVWRRLRSRE